MPRAGIPRNGPHLALIVTVPLGTIVLRGQLARLREAGFRVTLICGPGPQTDAMQAEGAEVVTVPMEREIAPLKDLISLWSLWRVLRRIRPDITNVGTPKAGLLGGTAARMVGISRRVYTLHGLRMETSTGWKRSVLTWAERIACWNAHYVRCVSSTLRARVLGLGLCDERKAYVVGWGTSNGVNCALYRRTPQRIKEALELRQRLSIPKAAPVIGFVGRLTRDKGIAELYRAFLRLKEEYPELRLLLLGDFESGDPVDAVVRKELESDPNVVLPGAVAATASYYAAMDVFALPTYREGFPKVTLEAQASSVPVVTTTATGAVESILDGISGKLVQPGNVEALTSALREMLSNPECRLRMGQAGSRWVEERYNQDSVWRALIEDYKRIYNHANRAVGA